MERETRNEMILARREPCEADASNADESRFLRNDLDVAESTQEVDESQGEVDDRWIGASKEGLEREASTRMPQIPRDETRTTPWAGPHRVLRAWHAPSLLVQDVRLIRFGRHLPKGSRLPNLRASVRTPRCCHVKRARARSLMAEVALALTMFFHSGVHIPEWPPAL
jgi:hypothetical protein